FESRPPSQSPDLLRAGSFLIQRRFLEIRFRTSFSPSAVRAKDRRRLGFGQSRQQFPVAKQGGDIVSPLSSQPTSGMLGVYSPFFSPKWGWVWARRRSIPPPFRRPPILSE